MLPLTAYGLLGSKEAVGLLYTAVSRTTLGFSFATPAIVGRLSRRRARTARRNGTGPRVAKRPSRTQPSRPGRK